MAFLADSPGDRSAENVRPNSGIAAVILPAIFIEAVRGAVIIVITVNLDAGDPIGAVTVLVVDQPVTVSVKAVITFATLGPGVGGLVVVVAVGAIADVAFWARS